MPEPASGPVVASPFSVSCVSVNECVTVGADADGDHTYTLAETWNGVRWFVSSTRNPAGRYARLTGVSCVWGDCEAVGWYTAGPRNFTVAERRAGSSWTTESTAHLPGLSVLAGVSCRTILFCTAVGDQNAEVASRGPSVLVEHWNGSRWEMQSVPGSADGGAAPVLLGVSCPSILACMAVGYTNDRVGGQAAVAASWVRGEWSFIPVPG